MHHAIAEDADGVVSLMNEIPPEFSPAEVRKDHPQEYRAIHVPEEMVVVPAEDGRPVEEMQLGNDSVGGRVRRRSSDDLPPEN